MTALYIGTCSFKYPSWEQLVYSSRIPDDYLAEYARMYASVEIDQWFWSLGKDSIGFPRPFDVHSYAASVPPHFRFTIKCPNAITLTHHYSRSNQLEANRSFLDPQVFETFHRALEPIHPNIGMYIFQFEYLNRTKMPDRKQFLQQLAQFFSRLPEGPEYGLEIRNPRWIDETWFESLSAMRVAPVLIQGYWMDDIVTLLERHMDHIGHMVGIRLHGDDRSGIEEVTKGEWDRIVSPKDMELPAVAASVTRLLQGNRVVYVNVNNHYEGSAPRTISKLMKYLNLEKPYLIF